MGEAKRRGTYEERKAQAQNAGRRKMAFYSQRVRNIERAAKQRRIRAFEALMRAGQN